MRLIDADILGEIKSPVKEDVGDYDVRAFRKGWNMAIDTIMENAPTEPVIDKVLEIIETAHFDLDDSARERDVYMRVSEYRKWMKKAVLALKGGEHEDSN